MQFQLSDVLKAIGPTASIIFAAWIFLSFLQSRYDAAIERYRGLLADYRKSEKESDSAGRVKREIEVYARRCTIMSWAISVGLVSAVLFLVTLIGGALDVMFPHSAAITVVSSIAGILGFALVIVAAALVIFDNIGAPNQIRLELNDVPDISSRSATRSTKLAE